MTLAALRYLALGAGATIALALATIAVSTAVGLGLAWARLHRRAAVRAVAGGWVLVMRGVPLLILLIGGYFSLPYLGIDLPLTIVAVLIMGLYFGAYMGEVFRAAIGAVPRTQWDAGRSLGFRPWQTFTIAILPQARRLCAAPYLNTALRVVKNTSLVSAIGGWELVAAGREVGERTGDLLPVYLAVGAAYFALCFPLSRLATLVERSSHG